MRKRPFYQRLPEGVRVLSAAILEDVTQEDSMPILFWYFPLIIMGATCDLLMSSLQSASSANPDRSKSPV
jgi:hypothetical protein